MIIILYKLGYGYKFNRFDRALEIKRCKNIR